MLGTHVARGRALFIHERRVAITLPSGGPPRAVTLRVLALGFANTTAHWAFSRGEVGVLGAFAKVSPSGALGQAVFAHWRADAAGGRAVAQHEVGVCVALSIECP